MSDEARSRQLWFLTYEDVLGRYGAPDVLSASGKGAVVFTYHYDDGDLSIVFHEGLVIGHAMIAPGAAVLPTATSWSFLSQLRQDGEGGSGCTQMVHSYRSRSQLSSTLDVGATSAASAHDSTMPDLAWPRRLFRTMNRWKASISRLALAAEGSRAA